MTTAEMLTRASELRRKASRNTELSKDHEDVVQTLSDIAHEQRLEATTLEELARVSLEGAQQ